MICLVYFNKRNVRLEPSEGSSISVGSRWMDGSNMLLSSMRENLKSNPSVVTYFSSWGKGLRF